MQSPGLPAPYYLTDDWCARGRQESRACPTDAISQTYDGVYRDIHLKLL